MKLWHKLSPLAVLPLALLAAPAHAQLTLTLTPDTQVGNPSDILNFSGTLSNSTADSVFLNSDTISFSGPAAQPDDTPFLTNAPLSLDAMGGNDTYTGGLFTVTLNPDAAPGTYFGTFSILGGADGSASDIVASKDFSVTVPDTNPVPEASTTVSFGLLLLLGGAGVWSAKRRKTAAH